MAREAYTNSSPSPPLMNRGTTCTLSMHPTTTPLPSDTTSIHTHLHGEMVVSFLTRTSMMSPRFLSPMRLAVGQPLR